MSRAHLHQSLFTTEAHGGIPAEEITYNVFLDYDILLTMARKAAKRKTRKCVAGPILVKIHARKPLEDPPLVNVHIIEKPELGGADQ